MWSFHRKESLLQSGALQGWTDWHCHILPGVDDGIPQMESALKTLHAYAEMGIREVWLTPHIMEDVPNTTEKLRARFEQLKAACQEPLQLHLAAENMLDNLFEERLEANDLLPLKDNRLLVETSYFNPPYNFWGILERIQSKGYYPLLAHPERYVYMEDKEYGKLKDMGVALQLNLPSLCGLYGIHAQKKALKLLKQGAYQRCGSDLHRLSPIQAVFSEKRFDKKTLTLVRELCNYQGD